MADRVKSSCRQRTTLQISRHPPDTKYMNTMLSGRGWQNDINLAEAGHRFAKVLADASSKKAAAEAIKRAFGG
jgi:hypothetical protein